jgi:hypothetical protein
VCAYGSPTFVLILNESHSFAKLVSQHELQIFSLESHFRRLCGERKKNMQSFANPFSNLFAQSWPISSSVATPTLDQSFPYRQKTAWLLCVVKPGGKKNELHFVLNRVTHKGCCGRGPRHGRCRSYTRMRKLRVRFTLHNIYLLNINCNVRTLDGTQIVNSPVSYTHHRKRTQI